MLLRRMRRRMKNNILWRGDIPTSRHPHHILTANTTTAHLCAFDFNLILIYSLFLDILFCPNYVIIFTVLKFYNQFSLFFFSFLFQQYKRTSGSVFNFSTDLLVGRQYATTSFSSTKISNGIEIELQNLLSNRMIARLSVFFIVLLMADRQCHGYVIAKSSVTYPAMNFFQENFTQYSSRSTFPLVVPKYTIGCGFSDKTAKDDLAPASVFVGHNYSDTGDFLDSYFFQVC